MHQVWVSPTKWSLMLINIYIKSQKDNEDDDKPDSSLAAAVAMAPFDSGFDPWQRRHLIRAQLVSQLIRVQLVLLDWGINQQNL